MTTPTEDARELLDRMPELNEELHIVIRDNFTSVLTPYEVELRAALRALIEPPTDDDREPWTPSTEQVRSHYVFDQTDRWSPERGAAFDRWLDSFRRQVSHPEPEEWEYGVAWRWNDMICAYPEVDEASARAGAQRNNDLAEDEDDTEFFAARRHPQRSASPWLPVPEEEKP